MPRLVRWILGATPIFAVVVAPAVSSAEPVSDLAGLEEALAEAQGGEVIRLAPGTYDELQLIDGRGDTDASFSSPVTVTSADPSNPARLTGVDIRGASNLTFEGIVFDYEFEGEDPIYLRPFAFKNTSNLKVLRSVFDGDLAKGVSTVEDGHGWAIGLSIDGSRNIEVRQNHFSDFHRGLAFGSNDATLVSGNELESIRMDGMNFVGMQDVRIEGNYLHDFDRALGSDDHSDMIQFWTNGSERPSTEVVIRNNVLLSADGDATQSIFMRNEEVDRGRAGEEMFYDGVTISQNVIVNGHLHGITLGESRDVSIRNNTLLRNQASAEGEMENERVRIPQINVAEQSRGVTIRQNLTGGLPEASAGWKLSENFVVQDTSIMKPGYYSRFFSSPMSGNQGDLESFVYAPALRERHSGRYIGADILQPESNRSAFQN